MQTGLLSTFVIVVWFHVWWLKYKESEWIYVPLVTGIMILFMGLCSFNPALFFKPNKSLHNACSEFGAMDCAWIPLESEDISYFWCIRFHIFIYSHCFVSFHMLSL